VFEDAYPSHLLLSVFPAREIARRPLADELRNGRTNPDRAHFLAMKVIQSPLGLCRLASSASSLSGAKPTV
jgi:hypothetical protein